MEKKHTGKIIGLMVLMFVSSYGGNIETLLQANVDYDKAGGYAFLSSLLGLCGSALIAMTIPLVCRLIKGKKLSRKWGRLLCVVNSIVAVVISAILQEMFDILFVGGIGAIIYYFINKWLFVAGKEELTDKDPTTRTHANGSSKMSLSFPDEKTHSAWQLCDSIRRCSIGAKCCTCSSNQRNPNSFSCCCCQTISTPSQKECEVLFLMWKCHRQQYKKMHRLWQAVFQRCFVACCRTLHPCDHFGYCTDFCDRHEQQRK